MNVKHKNFLVYGMSMSGEWVAKLLVKKKANVFLFDDDYHTLKNKTIKDCYVLNELNENFILQFDYIVVSPSIEKDNEYLKIAREGNIKIFSEVELASKFCKHYVAVTGTNGKTTTVKIIEQLLTTKHKAKACGNIGYPVSRAALDNKKAIKVIEVSSFMLENCESFSPHVATITNITSDHLTRHKTIEEYSKLKQSIFKNLKANDYAVVNLDENICEKSNCLTLTYSYNHIADVCVRNDAIYLHNEKVISLNDLSLKGKHNVYNVMCAICFAYIYKVKIEKMRDVLKNLRPEKFRIEHIANINKIKFVNDSKSTNQASTLSAIDTVKGAIILILGGSNKNLNYEKMFQQMTKRVKEVVVYGEIANQLIYDNQNKFPIKKCNNLQQSFEYACSIAISNDTILLSPATASYDQFKNYIERGNEFNRLVAEYAKKEQKK